VRSLDAIVEEEYLADPERDPLMCAAFRLVAQYAPGVLKTQKDSFPFLWQAIYPKGPADKPIFNSSGKYCVKLFVAGKWRKITISDKLPVSKDGKPAIACSSEQTELWPTILAKAVYTVYHTCGYHATFPTTGVRDEGSRAARKSASFIGLVVHLLTGWLPNQAWSLADCADQDPDRMEGLVQQMIFGGVVKVSEDDIPDHEPLIKTKNDEMTHKERKFTKKQLKAEARRKQDEKKSLKQAITAREQKIERLDIALGKPFAEWFAVCLPATNGGGVQVLPVLGISYPDNKEFDSALLLIQWVVKEPVDQQFPSDSSVSSQLPGSTPIESAWMGVGELNTLGGFVFSVDTLMRIPYKTEISWHWMSPDDEMNRKKGKGKDSIKEKEKEKGKKVVPSSTDEVQEQDSYPPTLLKIDLATFISSIPPPKVAPRRIDRVASNYSSPSVATMQLQGSHDHSAATSVDDSTMSDARALLHAQDTYSEKMEDETESIANPTYDSALCRYLDSKSLKRKKHYISISLFIHEDTMIQTVRKDEMDLSLQDGGSEMGSEVEVQFLPDTVLVLQELRTDMEDPYIIRVQLGTHRLPINRVTVHIPVEQLPPKPMLFWVRLFSISSLYCSIHCSAPVTIGPAEQIWESVGGKTTVFTGETAPTPIGIERMFFRLPLKGENSITSALTCDSDVIQEATEETFSTVSSEDMAICYLSIIQKDVTPYVSILLRDDATKNKMPLPLLDGNMIPISSGHMKTMFGRCFHATAHLPGFTWKLLFLHQQPIAAVPSPQINCLQRFQGVYRPNNRLLLFRDILRVETHSFPFALRISTSSLPDIIEDINVEEDLCLLVKTYRKADRKLVGEFRSRGVVHMYKVEDTGFLPDPVIETEAEIIEASQLDNGKRRTSTQKGNIKPVPVPKKDDKLKKDLKKVETTDFIEVLIECYLDETAMNIPHHWRSRFPFEFSTINSIDPEMLDSSQNDLEAHDFTKSFTSSDNGRLPSDPQFIWNLDVLSGNILGVSHDTYDLERYTAMKNAWEAAQEGREEQATAAVSYVNEIKRVQKEMCNSGRSSPEFTHTPDVSAVEATPPTATASTPASKKREKSGRKSPPKKESHAHAQVETPPNPLEQAIQFLSTAIKVDLEIVKKREEIVSNLPSYFEHIEMIEEDEEITLVTKESIIEAKEQRILDVTESVSSAAESVERLMKLNENLRSLTRLEIIELTETAAMNMEEIKKTWSLRDKYKHFADSKNNALKYLLERRIQAMEVIAAENEVKDKKGKPVKGKDVKQKRK